MKRRIETSNYDREESIYAFYSEEELGKRHGRHKANAMCLNISYEGETKSYVLIASEVIKSGNTVESQLLADSSNWNYLQVDGKRFNRRKLEKIKQIIADNTEELVELMVDGKYLTLAEKTVELTREV